MWPSQLQRERHGEPESKGQHQCSSKHRQRGRSYVGEIARLLRLLINSFIRCTCLGKGLRCSGIGSLCLQLVREVLRRVHAHAWCRGRGRWSKRGQLASRNGALSFGDCLYLSPDGSGSRGEGNVHRVDATDGSEGVALALDLRERIQENSHLLVRSNSWRRSERTVG